MFIFLLLIAHHIVASVHIYSAPQLNQIAAEKKITNKKM